MIHRKLKIGVIGLGVGEQHVIGYQRIPNVEVTDICDIDPSVLKIVGDRLLLAFFPITYAFFIFVFLY